MFEKLLEWDQQALIFINNSGSEQFDAFWLITTSFLTWIPLFIFIVLLFFHTYSREEATWILLSVLSMLVMLVIVIFITKESVERLRPVNNFEFNSALRILTKPADYSFFSGHAASSFSIAMLSIFYLRKKITLIYILLLWPLLFAFSRMYLGVHYPLDILVGSIVGILFATIFYRMHQKFRAPYIM